MTSPVTWAYCARVNAIRWAAIGAVFGVAVTGLNRAWWSR